MVFVHYFRLWCLAISFYYDISFITFATVCNAKFSLSFSYALEDENEELSNAQQPPLNLYHFDKNILIYVCLQCSADSLSVSS